ncbi:MAG: MMPL family transporter [Deltaproteobacteria bacterium]|nr:MMPL family transporter [Deltaproteobacteria bacterium]
MYERIARFLLRHFLQRPVVALVLIFLSVMAATPSAIHLFGNIQTDLASLLPDDYRSVKLIKEVRQKMEGVGSLLIVLDGRDKNGMIRFADDLTQRLLQSELVRGAVFKKPGYTFFSNHKLLYVDLDDLKAIRDRISQRVQREKLGPLFFSFEDETEQKKLGFQDLEKEYREKYSEGTRSPYYESDDGTIFLIHVYPIGSSSNLGFAKKLTEEVRQIVQGFDLKQYDPNLHVDYAGSFQTRINEYNTLIHDLTVAGIIASIGVVLLLLYRFRSLIALLVVLAPMGAGLAWTFGLTTFLVGHLNLVTSFLFSILTGLGVEFGIHLFSRYLEAKESGRDVEGAIHEMTLRVGRSSLTSAATAGVPFLLLGLNDFKGFSEFGLITGSGIIISLLAYLLILPPLILLLEKHHWLQVRAIHQSLFGHNRRHRFPKARLVFWSTLALSLFCLPFVSRLHFEYDFNKLKPFLPAYDEVRAKTRLVIPAGNNPAMLLVANDKEALQVKEALLAKKERGTEDSFAETLIDRVKIASDLVPGDQEAKLKVIGEIKQLLEDPLIRKFVKGKREKDIEKFTQSLELTEVTLADVPEDAKRIFYGRKEIPGQVVFVFSDPRFELSDGQIAMRFRDEVASVVTPQKTFYATSDAIIFAEVLRAMLKDSTKAIVLTLLGVLFFVALDFRKPLRVALVMLPIVGGVFWMCGIMALIGLKFNFYNMVVVPAVIATAIDNGVHMYHRYIEEGFTSVWTVVRTAGQAAFLSSMMNIFGFMGLVFANHRGLASIGQVAMIGMVSCMITSLTIFPAVLQVLQDWRKKGTL